MEDHKSFVLYTDTAPVFETLTDEQAGKLIKHIFAYVQNEETQPLEPVMQAIFMMFRAQLDRDAEKWAEVKEKRREAVMTRWARQKHINDTNVSDVLQAPSNDTVNVSESVNESVSGSVSERVSNSENDSVTFDTEQTCSTSFQKPTLEEIHSFWKNNNRPAKEADCFFDYYESNGWMTGRNPVKNWRAAARNWMRR